MTHFLTTPKRYFWFILLIIFSVPLGHFQYAKFQKIFRVDPEFWGYTLVLRPK